MEKVRTKELNLKPICILGLEASGKWHHVFSILSTFVIATVLMAPFAAHAQVLRNFGNTGFESPVSPMQNPCYSELLDTDVPSWSTSHPVSTGGQDTCNFPGASANGGVPPANINLPANNPGPTTYSGSFIELQAHGFQSVYANPARRIWAREGVQFAELSAKVDSTLFQQICFVPGELVTWKFSHLGLQGSETMRFVVSPTTAGLTSPALLATTAATGGIVQATTNTNGVGAIGACHAGSNIQSQTTCTVTSTTVNAPAGYTPAGQTTTWADYSGSFLWNGPAGNNYIAFGAITPSGADFGNLIDRVEVTLKPYVEFASASSSGLESVLNPTNIGIKVTGVVTSAMTVPVVITGGTAVFGTDYTTSSGTTTFNINVPAGTYDGTTIIGIGTAINIINDTLTEGNETIILQIGVNAAYVVTSTTVCGAAPNNIITYTIVDDDRPHLSINKTRIGGTGTINFPFTVTNTTPASGTIATAASGTPATVAALTNASITTDLTAITVGETLPVGSAANGFWGLSAVTCIDANAGNAALGNTNPATNLATAVTATGFTIPAANVQHTSNITCDVTNVLVNAIDDTANKIANLPSTTSVNTNDTYPTGSTFFSTGGTCTGRSPTTAGTANTTGVMSYTSPATTGATCTVIYQVCAPAPNAAVCDTATLLVTATAPEAVLVITKTDAKTIATSGGTNDYVVTVTNQGPSPANGVVLTDTPSAGLTCPPANPVVCSVITAGAVCPTGTLTLGNLISPGYTITTFPANSGLQFTYTCNVN